MLDAFPVGNLNANPPLPPLLYRRIQIPNAVVRTLFSSPLTIVPAQGATKVILPEFVFIHKPAGTAFTGGTSVDIQWPSTTLLWTILVAGFLNQATKVSAFGFLTVTPLELVSALGLNVDLQLTVSASNPATSLDTDLFLVLTYRIFELAQYAW